MSLPDEPITRTEQYLAKMAGQEAVIPAEPITRVEQYLDYIVKNGIGGGSELPAVTEADNGKLLGVEDGAWGKVDASANGQSAYEIAVDTGFVGDEQAWLDSLVGPPGRGISAIYNDPDDPTRVTVDYSDAVSDSFVLPQIDLNAFGATYHQVPLADGTGGWSWGDLPDSEPAFMQAKYTVTGQNGDRYALSSERTVTQIGLALAFGIFVVAIVEVFDMFGAFCPVALSEDRVVFSAVRMMDGQKMLAQITHVRDSETGEETATLTLEPIDGAHGTSAEEAVAAVLRVFDGLDPDVVEKEIERAWNIQQETGGDRPETGWVAIPFGVENQLPCVWIERATSDRSAVFHGRYLGYEVSNIHAEIETDEETGDDVISIDLADEPYAVYVLTPDMTPEERYGVDVSYIAQSYINGVKDVDMLVQELEVFQRIAIVYADGFIPAAYIDDPRNPKYFLHPQVFRFSHYFMGQTTIQWVAAGENQSIGLITFEMNENGETRFRITPIVRSGSALPEVSSDDDNRVLAVENGAWVARENVFITTVTGTPASGGIGAANHSGTEIKNAFGDGKTCYAIIDAKISQNKNIRSFGNIVLPLVATNTSNYCVFSSMLKSTGGYMIAVTVVVIGIMAYFYYDDHYYQKPTSGIPATDLENDVQSALLPAVTTDDNGKILKVVNGVWTAVDPD